MDNVTLTFLQGLADLLGMLPQQTQADPTRGQSNRGGITSSRTRRQGQRTSSRNRSDRAGRSTARVTSDASTRPGAIVRSPRGQLATTQPPGALAQRPSSALTTRMQGPSSAYTPDPFAGSATVPPSQGSGTTSSRAIAPGAQPNQTPRPAGPAQSTAQITSTRGYRGLGAEVLNDALRGGKPTATTNRGALGKGLNQGSWQQGLAELAGLVIESTLGRQLGKGIFDIAAQDPNTMAGRAAQRGITAAEYMDAGQPAYQGPGIPRRLLEGGGTQPTTTQPQRPRQVQYPTAAETQAAAPQVVAADAPPVAAPAAVPTARQLQKQDFDRQYDEKRAAALAISDPMARAKALEDVTTFGLQLHKEYFAK